MWWGGGLTHTHPHSPSSKCTAPPRLPGAPLLKSLWTCSSDVNSVAGAGDGSVTLEAPWSVLVVAVEEEEEVAEESSWPVPSNVSRDWESSPSGQSRWIVAADRHRPPPPLT